MPEDPPEDTASSPDEKPDTVQLSDLTPVELVTERAVEIPGTRLTATLLDWRYGRGRSPSGEDELNAWAQIRFESGCGDTDEVEWRFYQTGASMGHRFYLAGSRSQVLLYLLPPTEQGS